MKQYIMNKNREAIQVIIFDSNQERNSFINNPTNKIVKSNKVYQYENAE
jgi:hypothetical protein